MPTKLTQIEFLNRLPSNIQLIGEYKGINQKHEFICQCKNVFTTKAEHILTQHTKSCGCANRKGVGEVAGWFYSKLLVQAKHRNLEFKVSKQYLNDLLIQQSNLCKLSGLEIHIGYFRGKERSSVTASLDRIDSSKGYIEGNVQWVHKDINVMKRSMSDDKFIELCKIIVNFNERKSDE